MRRRCGWGGNSHSFWAMYSLWMSVCSVPPSWSRPNPWRSAATAYIANSTTAGPLMVIEVVMSPSGRPWNRRSTSSRVSTATPQWPTSPRLSGSSESRPISVGMSKATDRPCWPARSRSWYRRLLSSTDPNPANWRIVHGLPRYMDG